MSSANTAAFGWLEVIEHDATVPALPVLRRFGQKNRVVTTGLALLANLLSGDADGPLTDFALGDGTAAATAADTALQSEVYRDTITQTTASGTSLVVRLFLPSTAANGETLAEAGLLTASGTLYARALLSEALAKTSQRAYTFVWTLDFEYKPPS